MSYKEDFFLMALYKSICISIKCFLIDLYHYYTSFRSSRFLFVKYIYGGNINIQIISNRPGPKTYLEYGFIDEVRMDEVVSMLAGNNRNFSGHPESLFEFGNRIRYKFFDENEVIMESLSKGSDFKQKHKENIKKIKNLVWIS